MSVGLRVVRGPEWAHGDQDGGEGHVGTIVYVKTDNSVEVVWDNGNQLTCNVGKNGKKDLRVIDNAPAGIKHFGISCKECKRQPILGTRWKCCDCKDINICSICYFTDKHNLGHQFERYNRQTTNRPEKVSKRSTSQRMRAFGIFPGAVVVRGQDWNYGKDDGGPGSKGNVLEIKSYSGDTGTRNAVKIKWKNGKTGEYRIGACGKVDVKYVEPGVGTDYYREHLYIPDSSIRLTREVSFMDITMPPKRLPEVSDSSTEDAEDSMLDTVLHIGDRVCVFLPVDQLKEVQKGRGGWSMRMGECIGQIGKIIGIQSGEIVEVLYDGITWHFYQGALRKVYDVKKGDTVKVLSDPNVVERLQKGHGGWDTALKQTCGKVGKVEVIDKDGDIAVQFGEQVWVYSPACLIPAPGENQFHLKMEQSPSTSVMKRENTQDDLGKSLSRLVAHLMILGQQQQQLRIIGPEQMIEAVVKGDIEEVKKIIKLKKELVNCKFRELTPLMFACHGGHFDIVKLFVDNGADIDAQAEDGTTPVTIAASEKNEKIAMLLIDKGASVNFLDKQNKRTLAHHASYFGMTELLKKVLQKGCNPNQQDVEGDTALHDAITKGHEKAVDILLGHPGINLTIPNNKDFSPIIFAAFKENDYATEKILKKKPDLVNTTKKDGSTALHVAAVNDHRSVATTLISEDAEVDLQDRNGLTPLHLACHEGYFEMAELLIENDADVDVQDNDGNTPLHVTLGGQRHKLPGLLGLMMLDQQNDDSDRVKIACLLLNNDADIEIKNKQRKTPLQVCRSPRVKTGVENFIKQKEQELRTEAAGNPFLTLLAALLVVPCQSCQDNVANATFQPCGHMVVCEECSVKFDNCPKCRKEIEGRFDQEGRHITENPCNVQ